MEQTTPLIIDESTFRALVERAPGFITLIDADLRVRYNNRLVTGYEQESIIGLHVGDLLSSDQHSLILPAYDRARQTDEEQVIVYHVEASGEERWLFTRIAPLRDAAGVFMGYINMTTDITEQKRSEQALKKMQDELLEASHRAGMAEVATGILHNVGNVLNSVNVSATTLREGLSSAPIAMLARTVNLCQEQDDRLPEFLANDPRGQKVPELLGRLSEQLLDAQQRLLDEAQRLIEHVSLIRSTVEAQQSLARTGTITETVQPQELIARTLSMFHIDIENKHIDVDMTSEGIPPILLDKQGTLQILANVIRNAIEAMAEVDGPRMLRIKTYSSDDLVCFEIADNGCGISTENMDKIFRHGFTTKQNGHGFGLHSSAIAARAMGGSLEVHSDGPGQGARFCLSVPRQVRY